MFLVHIEASKISICGQRVPSARLMQSVWAYRKTLQSHLMGTGHRLSSELSTMQVHVPSPREEEISNLRRPDEARSGCRSYSAPLNPSENTIQWCDEKEATLISLEALLQFEAFLIKSHARRDYVLESHRLQTLSPAAYEYKYCG
jgi:hypothetical protein